MKTTLFRPWCIHKCLSYQTFLEKSGILVASCIKLFNIANTHMYLRIIESSKCSFFGKFGVLGFLVTTVLRFAVCFITDVLWFVLSVKCTISAGIYLFKVNDENTRTSCEICSKLTIKTPERRLFVVSQKVF